LQAVLVKISDAYSPTIVDVLIGHDVERIVVGDGVVEAHPRFLGRQLFKEAGFAVFATPEKKRKNKKYVRRSHYLTCLQGISPFLPPQDKCLLLYSESAQKDSQIF
jgi:hypothetical protein